MSETWPPKGARGAQFFCVVRDALLDRMEASVCQREDVPGGIQGCLDGIALCRKLETLAAFKSEVQARTPEVGYLVKRIDEVKPAEFVQAIRDCASFRHASGQIEWAYEVLRTGFGVVEPASVNLCALSVLRSSQG